MKAGPVNIDLSWQAIVALLIGAVGVYFLVKREIGGAAEAVGEAVNPTSRDNIIYRGWSAVVDVLDDGQDSESSTLGTKIYDWFKGDGGEQTMGYMEYRHTADGWYEGRYSAQEPWERIKKI